MPFFRSLLLAFAVPVLLAAVQDQSKTASLEPELTEEEMKQFLRTAKVVRNKTTDKGITRPHRLTLDNGRLTHDAAFQSVDVTKTIERFENGTTEFGFRDTFHFNIAAYELARLLGLGDMMPVTVERTWAGKKGAMSWWLPTKMDEEERLKGKIEPPDSEAWNRQMYRKRVFAELVYDVDPNLTNLLIGENWEVYMIDFTRAFRLYEKVSNPKNLNHCDRQLLERLRLLNKNEIRRATNRHLRDAEIKALLKRRDKIVEYIERLVKEKGEGAVIY
jgi:hypothetical protein